MSYFGDYSLTENEEDETGLLGDTDIIPIERGGYKVNLFVPSSFNGIIVGKMGKTKANIEKRTSCSIAIPKRGQKGPVGQLCDQTQGTTVMGYHCNGVPL